MHIQGFSAGIMMFWSQKVSNSCQFLGNCQNVSWKYSVPSLILGDFSLGKFLSRKGALSMVIVSTVHELQPAKPSLIGVRE